jgi:hypothetical protein
LRPGSRFVLFISCLLLSIFFSIHKAAAANRMEADEMSFSEGIFTLKGSVFFERDGITIHADEAVYNQKTSQLDLKGNMSYEDERVVLKGDQATFTLEDKTGSVMNAEIFVKKDGYFIKAEQVDKTGEDKYNLIRMTFTTCDSPHPAWSIRGKKARMVMGGAIKASNVTFYIKQTVPVFYFPVMFAPVLTQRHSGFLGATIGHSQFGGLNIQQPFFWAMAENRDLTLTLDYHSLRSMGLGAGYSFVEFGGYSGDIGLEYLRDWKDNRNYLILDGVSRAPFGNAFLDMVNYPDYYRLYSTPIEDRARRFLESKAEVTLSTFEDGRAYFVSRFFQDTTLGTDQETVIQRLPEVGVFINPARRGPFVFAADAALANFYRPEGQWGQRLFAAPRLSYSVGHAVNLFQSLEFRGLGYELYEPGESTARTAYNYEGSLRARFHRPYGQTTHFLEPTLSLYYRTRSGENPPEVFDSIEEEGPEQVLELAIINRLWRKGSEFLLFKASSQYDLKADEPFRPLQFDLFMARPVTIRASVTYDPNILSIEKANVETGFSPMKDLSFRMRESYSRPDKTWTHNFGFTTTPVKRITWEGDVWYDSKGAGLREMRTSVRYLAQCWGVRVVASKHPDDFSFYVKLEMPGLTKFGPS